MAIHHGKRGLHSCLVKLQKPFKWLIRKAIKFVNIKPAQFETIAGENTNQILRKIGGKVTSSLSVPHALNASEFNKWNLATKYNENEKAKTALLRLPVHVSKLDFKRYKNSTVLKTIAISSLEQ